MTPHPRALRQGAVHHIRRSQGLDRREYRRMQKRAILDLQLREFGGAAGDHQFHFHRHAIATDAGKKAAAKKEARLFGAVDIEPSGGVQSRASQCVAPIFAKIGVPPEISTPASRFSCIASREVEMVRG